MMALTDGFRVEIVNTTRNSLLSGASVIKNLIQRSSSRRRRRLLRATLKLSSNPASKKIYVVSLQMVH
jgi:hypothetical protein